jgi:hypothetical protein
MPTAEEAEVKIQYPGNSGSPAIVAGVPSSGTSWSEFYTAGMIPAANLFASFYTATVGPYGPIATGLLGLYEPITYAAVSTPGSSAREQTKSSEQIAFENRKARLISIVNSMKTSAPNWYGDVTTVNETSASSAEKFIRCLPGNALLPRVAPDGEGDVMFVWDEPNDKCVVTVERRTLHLVCKLGTPDVQQIPSQQFLGLQIPPAILAHIPTK